MDHDEIITFDPLDAQAIRHIVDIELEKLIIRVNINGYDLSFSDDAKQFLAEKGYDSQFGARPLKRAIQTYVEDELCEFMLNEDCDKPCKLSFNKSEKGDKLHIEIVKE